MIITTNTWILNAANDTTNSVASIPPAIGEQGPLTTIAPICLMQAIILSEIKNFLPVYTQNIKAPLLKAKGDRAPYS